MKMTYKTKPVKEPEVDVDLEEFRASTTPPQPNEHIEHFLQVEERHSRGEYVGRDSTELWKVVSAMSDVYGIICADPYHNSMYGRHAQEVLNQLRKLHANSLISPTGSASYQASHIIKTQLPPKRVLNPRSRK